MFNGICFPFVKVVQYFSDTETALLGAEACRRYLPIGPPKIFSTYVCIYAIFYVRAAWKKVKHPCRAPDTPLAYTGYERLHIGKCLRLALNNEPAGTVPWGCRMPCAVGIGTLRNTWVTTIGARREKAKFFSRENCEECDESRPRIDVAEYPNP